MKTMFEAMGGTYRQEGDYLLPDVKVPENPQIGIWGERLPWRGEYALSNSLFLIIWSRKNGLPGLPAGRFVLVVTN